MRTVVLLIYDGECPLCHRYSQLLRIRDTVGELQLVNARQSSDILEEVSAKGFDIDQGMVLKMGGQLYFGADAIHVLALISSRSGIFNRVNYWIFKSKTASMLLYPLLKFFRNLLLILLGKSRIND